MQQCAAVTRQAVGCEYNRCKSNDIQIKYAIFSGDDDIMQKSSFMRTKLKVALIGGIIAIVIAVIQYGPGWWASGEEKGYSGKADNLQRNTIGKITHTGDGDVSVRQTNVIDRGHAVNEKIIETQDWVEAESNPVFRRFVRSRYRKDIDALNQVEKATFWQDMRKYLNEEKEAKKNMIKSRAGV